MYKLIAFRSEFRTLNLVIFKNGQNPVWTPKVAKTLWDSNNKITSRGIQCTSRYHRYLLDTGGTRGGTILHAADSVAAAVNLQSICSIPLNMDQHTSQLVHSG